VASSDLIKIVKIDEFVKFGIFQRNLVVDMQWGFRNKASDDLVICLEEI
jgi:hypothetical protein